MPSRNHARLQLRIGAAFLRFTDFAVFSELTLELPDGSRITPDLCVYPQSPSNWLHDDVRMTTMPRMAVEIISPFQPMQEIVDKLDLYFSQGVESVWVVQPALQIIAIYSSSNDRPQVITTGEAKDPATGLTVQLEEIFA